MINKERIRKKVEFWFVTTLYNSNIFNSYGYIA